MSWARRYILFFPGAPPIVMDMHHIDPCWSVSNVFLYPVVCNQDIVLPVAPCAGSKLRNELFSICIRPNSLGVHTQYVPYLVMFHIPGTFRAIECMVAHVSQQKAAWGCVDMVRAPRAWRIYGAPSSRLHIHLDIDIVDTCRFRFRQPLQPITDTGLFGQTGCLNCGCPYNLM